MCFSCLKWALLVAVFGFASALFCRASEDQSDFNGPKYVVTFGMGYTDFLPGSLIRMEVRFKNITQHAETVTQEFVVLDKDRLVVWKTVINLELGEEGNVKIPLLIPVPKTAGIFTLTLGHADEIQKEFVPSFEFNVIRPQKSSRLSKILVYSPAYEENLNLFLKTWEIKAPNYSWAQVLLLGKEGWAHYIAGEPEISQLISRSLRREMSVIFLDFGSSGRDQTTQSKIFLPFDVKVSFSKLKSPERVFILKGGYPELTYGLATSRVDEWNGSDGFTVPDEEMRFEGKGVRINALATCGVNPIRFPLVEVIPVSGKGKLYLCQLSTEGRIDETIQPARYEREIPVYDPVAVQLLLNLISVSVGDDLLK